MTDVIAYHPRFHEFLKRAEVDEAVLPSSLQNLIEKFEKAKAAWEQETTATQNQLLPVLVKTDAVISAQIYQLYKDRLESSQVDKVKLMALKAKALKLKWKLKKD
jgi:hypothetical protein